MSHQTGLVTMMQQRNTPTYTAHIAIWDEKYEIYTDDEYFDNHGFGYQNDEVKLYQKSQLIGNFMCYYSY